MNVTVRDHFDRLAFVGRCLRRIGVEELPK